MIVLAGCALVVGVLTFIDVRQPDATLIAALAAIIFALPVFRNALPGSPPLGGGCFFGPNSWPCWRWCC